MVQGRKIEVGGGGGVPRGLGDLVQGGGCSKVCCCMRVKLSITIPFLPVLRSKLLLDDTQLTIKHHGLENLLESLGVTTYL